MLAYQFDTENKRKQKAIDKKKKADDKVKARQLKM
jgi:hypothetical protein